MRGVIVRLSAKFLAVSGLVGLASCAGSVGSSGTHLAGSTPQGWNSRQQIAWYRGSQGSRLIPEAWLFALEHDDSTTLFLDPSNFERFNYLPAAPGEKAKLPIGFARDVRNDSKLPMTGLRWFKGQGKREPWVGLNCAACHTAEITYGSNTYRVDGAPTLGDFQSLTDALRSSMQKTYDDSAKWARFAARIVVPRRRNERNNDRVDADHAALKRAFGALLTHQNDVQAYNATKSVYGHGRLDAVGHILNKVAYLNADVAPIRGEPDAPVSYPFIWNAAQHDFVQWNGLVPNQNREIGRGSFDIGALVRNTSEVIGVFADVKTRQYAGLNGYKSSVDVKNLAAMEKQLRLLMSPSWPTAFGVPKPAEVAAGKVLFEDFKCSTCHRPLDRTDLKTPIEAKMSPIWGKEGVGTDPWMVCNTFGYQAKGGVLTGTKDKIFGETELPAIGPTQLYLTTQAVGVLLNQKFKILLIAAREALGIERPIEVFEDEAAVERPRPSNQPVDRSQRLENCKNETAHPKSDESRRTLAYKARPLNGIWATAPYLHNGSVKSLYELLLPPGERATEFWVGNREFDVVNVGFVDKRSRYGSLFETTKAGVPIIGNSNAGHDYGNSRMNPEQRRLLVEYMKSL